MTTRNPPEIRDQIGREVREARQNRIQWKVLERKYGYTRARLRMLANAVSDMQEMDISDTPLAFRS